MKAPKSWFVAEGIAELGLAGAAVDMDPEMIERVSLRLDANLAELETKGARVSGWVFSSEPEVNNGGVIVNVPNGLVNLVILSAAIVAAPSIGKNLSSVTVAQLKLARDNLMNFQSSNIPSMRRNTNMPFGSGNQQMADGPQFYRRLPPQLGVGPDSNFDNPDIELWGSSSNGGQR
ncbi:packaged DNA stabilization gp4 family protein [Robbsia andropogonis]|uniref:packaged DNA stabilization gp4 family protein n=1 Tax=Robbsia andropogonis TaxID=28092 RepID=UPI000466D1A0|nr:packaged DNA stabilization gp4 family protein [Robbsia andropogonis]